LTAKLILNIFIAVFVTAFSIILYKPVLWVFFVDFIMLIIIFSFLEEKIFSKYAAKNSVNYTLAMTYPIYILKSLLYPFYHVFVHTDSAINSKIVQNKYKITLDELSDILDLSSVSSKDTRLIKGIMKFGDTDVKEIMKSRVDVTAVDEKISFNELNEVIIESGYSRIPVYSESFDNIKGILFVKDLWSYMHSKNQNADFKWQDMIRPAYFAPETRKINDLLKDFQRNKVHIAIVNDEYGGTYGIVTLEDIIEEIVGEISDESDEEEIIFSQIDENNYIFEGKILLNDLYRILQINDDTFDEIKGDSDTLAGLILDLRGEIPEKDERIKYKNFTFKIESVDKRRIKQIKLTIEREESENNDENN